jgi:O-antigen ligase
MMAAIYPNALAHRAVTLAAIGVIFIGLLGRGGDGAAPAALLSAALLAVLVARIWTLPGSALAQALRANALTAWAALGFIVIALLSAVIAPAGGFTNLLGGLWHPLWAELSPENRAMSLAPYRTLEGVLAFLGPCAAFAIGAMEPDTRAGRAWQRGALAGFSALLVAAAIGAHALGAGEHGDRLSLYFVSPNAAATCFGVLAMLAAGSIARAARSRSKTSARGQPRFVQQLAGMTGAPIATAVFLLSVSCILLTGSRAGIAAAVAAFAAFAVLLMVGRMRSRARRAHRTAGWTLAAPVAAGALLIYAGGHVALGRLHRTNADIDERASLWQTHWQAFLDRPIIGHGLNTFRDINAHYATPEHWAALHVVGAAHNIYIQALEETGLIGMGLFVLMLAGPVWRALRQAVHGGRGAELAAGVIGATVMCLIHGLVDFGLQTPAIAALLAYSLASSANVGAASDGDSDASDADSADGPENQTQRSRSGPD